MKDKRLRALNYGIAFGMVIVVAFLYPRLPKQIPTNWSFDGSVTYGPRHTIWMITGMLVFFAFMYDILPYIDPRKKNYQKFGKIYDLFGVGLQIFLAITVGIIISESFYPGRIHASKVVLIILSLLFVLIGNFMPKIQSNFFMGIKTPWTLSNYEVWRKTHRLAGRLYVGSGILTLLASVLFPVPVAGGVLFVTVLGTSVAVALASYLWWRKAGGADGE